MGIGRTFLVIALAALMATGAAAQDTRTVNGRKFMVHTVQGGQTLYAISRSYAVPVDSLISSNPASAFGLSIGQELLVPLNAVEKKELRTAPLLRNDGELLHTVRKKETLFGISRSYQVDVNDLLERNPKAVDLKEGMTLIIPVSSVTGARKAALEPAVDDGSTLHEVMPGETLFALAERYGISVEAILAANGGLPAGLKTGERIRIPTPKEPATEEVNPSEGSMKERYHIALLLPFSKAQNDSVIAGSTEDGKATFYEPTRIAVQFYQGARLALDSLEQLGLQADVAVYDMGDDKASWKAMANLPELQQMDLCIGPFHRTAIEQLARSGIKAHIVCPVPQSNKVVLGYPQVSKVTPSRTDRVRQTGRYVAHRHAMDNILIVLPSIPEEADLRSQMEGALNNALAQQPTTYRDSARVVRPTRKDLSAVIAALDATRMNVLVVPSEDIEFVSALVTKLKPQAADQRIILVGFEEWITIPSLDANDLDLLGFTYAAGTFTDLMSPAVLGFKATYNEQFGSDPDEYAMLGFDVTFYFVKALFTQGTGFAAHFDQVASQPLHMGFRMTRTGPENGFRNENAFMLQQKDLLLQKVH